MVDTCWRALALAVVRRAVEDLVRANQKEREKARRWLECEEGHLIFALAGIDQENLLIRLNERMNERRVLNELSRKQTYPYYNVRSR